MKKSASLFIPLFFLIIFTSCTSTEQTTKTEQTGKDSVYVFDEVPADTAKVVQKAPPPVVPVQPSGTYYLIQVGAFTTQEKAEVFTDSCRQKLNRDLIIIYSNTVNLFVVQLTETFTSRTEAELVRNELWKNPDFKDAWILTVNK